MKRKLSLLVILFLCVFMGRASAGITGTLSVCTGATTTLTGTPVGATWTSSDGTVATVDPSTGVVTGVGGGTVTITYNSVPYATAIVTVNGVRGNPFICDASHPDLLGIPNDGGTWTSSAPGIITVSSLGVLSRGSLTSGTATITHEYGGCITTLTATSVQMVPITGTPTVVCVGSTITYSYSGSGGGLPGAWSMAPGTTIAGVDAGGVVTGLQQNGGLTAQVYYSFSDGTNTCRTEKAVKVNDTAALTDVPIVCVGSTINLQHASGGSWTSIDPSTANFLDPSLYYKLSGIIPGTARLIYTKGGCTSHIVATVNPGVSSIGGTLSVCNGSTTTLTNSNVGGTWQCSPPPAPVVATIGASTGVITGTAVGSTIITYTGSGPASTSCAGTVTAPFTVYALPESITTSAGGTFCDHTTITANFTSCTGISCGTIYFQGTTSGGTSTSTPSTSEVITTTGTYYFRAKSAGGCWGPESSVTVEINPCPVTLNVCETAPIEICGTKFTYCPGFTLQVAGAPAGCTYSLPSGLESYVSSQSSSTAGGIVTTTYIFGSSPETGDYTITGCGGSITIHIVKPRGTCSPCEGFAPVCTGSVTMTTPAFKTITSAVLTSPEISTTTPDYYYIVDKNARLAVSPAPGSVFYMADSVRLNIAAGDNINISGCHFFSKPESSCHWAGIQINTDASGTTPIIGQLTINGGSLIEYADTAVFVDSVISGGATPASGNILTVYNATFNANLVGIRIRGFNAQTTLPFSFTNSVFTARDFTCYSASGSHYPSVWPDVAALKSYSGDENDPAYGVDAYTALTGVEMWGIDIIDAGKSVPTGTPDPSSGNAYTFYSVVVGDPANSSNSNLFDNLRRGVRALSSSVEFYNNVFRHTNNSGSSTSFGIHYWNFTPLYPNHTRNTVQLLKGTGANTHNKFYNCNHAVFSQYAYNFVSRYTRVSGTNVRNSSTVSIPAVYGFNFQDTMLDYHELRYDTIINVQNAIYEEFTGSSTCASQGPVTITDNQIFGLVPSNMDAFMDWGIKIYSPRTCTSACQNVTISNNQIEGGVNGITLETHSLNTLVENNTIVLRDNGLPMPYNIRSGIICQNSEFIAGINKNKIYGDVSYGVTASTPHPDSSLHDGGEELDGVRGIYLSSVSNTSSTPRTSVHCNSVSDMAIGFKFGKENQIDWTNNEMANNTYGMLLQCQSSIPAIIGIQGSSCTPSDNRWTGSTIYHTYSVGSNPALSKIYVRTSGLPDMPSSNGRTNFTSSIVGVAYTSSSSTSLEAVGCTPPAYEACPTIGASRFATSENEGVSPKVDNIVKAGQHYMAYPNPGNGNITIAREDGGNVEAKVRVINAVGATVYSGTLQLNNGKADLSIPNAAPGIYLVELTDNKGSNIFRISVQK